MRTRLPLLAVALALAAGGATSGAQGHQPSRHPAGRSGVVTYAEQGVTVSRPSARAAHDAAASSLPTPAAAVTALRRSRWAQAAFSTGMPVASLHTVTEKYPVAKGVRVGVPYQAWVVRVRGPVIFTGGPGSTPPPAGTKCTDVAIYDLQLSRWTESVQSC
jgi:hypothetical protein